MDDDAPPPAGPNPSAPVAFGRLEDLLPREAWGHEARAFTPWLAENIDRLAEAVGMELELTGQEVRVDRYAADILAGDLSDGSIVLIENQLGPTDHTHLGQIMTYLAGLEARSVIWIAPEFREPHLSAIRWLNEHTAEGFAFFAVRLRVVRIGDSPMAPVFEVVEKPNRWERRLSTEARQRDASARRKLYRPFWQQVAQFDPKKSFRPRASAYHHTPLPARIRIVSYIGDGIDLGSLTFVENVPGEGVTLRSGGVLDNIRTRGALLATKLGAHEAIDWRTLCKAGPGSLNDQSTWSEAAGWLIATRDQYMTVLGDYLDGIDGEKG